MFKAPHEQTMVHPLAKTALIVSLAGIPLIGLITGPIAVVLAAIALNQMSYDSSFQGRGIATAAMVIGIGDMILWVMILGFMVPHMSLPVSRRGDRLIFPSGDIRDNAPAPIKQALENNVFFLVKTKRWPFFLTPESTSGSGVVLRRTGSNCLILTNRHVVDSSFTTSGWSSLAHSASITAYFYDGTNSSSHIRWTAPNSADLALVATDGYSESLSVPESTVSRSPEIGDKVFTVGNPYDLTWSYNEGVISAVRELPGAGGGLLVYQTQTPINEGNSGGGLYSSDGTLIGIVTWTKDKSHAEGISFAIAYSSFLQLFGAE